MIQDATLLGLLADRTRIMRDLSPVLARVGSNTPNRKRVNKERSKKRKALRRGLRMNSEAIAARCMEMKDE